MQFARNSLSLFIKCVTHHKRDGGVVHLNMKLGDEFGSGNEGRDAIVKHLISDLSETPEQNQRSRVPLWAIAKHSYSHWQRHLHHGDRTNKKKNELHFA